MRRPLAFLLLAGLAGLGLASSCTLAAGLDLSFGGSGGSTSSSGSTSTGSTGSTSSGSTSSSSSGCTAASQCPAVPAGPCAARGEPTCTSGMCEVSYDGGPATSQAYGSCHQNVCQADGMVVSVVDDMNVFNSGNPCMPYVCTNGSLNPNPLPGSACGPDGGTGACVLDPDMSNPGVYICAQCNPTVANSCMGMLGGKTSCEHGTCTVGHCVSGGKDSNETDVDCGGPECTPCQVGQKCAMQSDCYSKLCSGGTCQAASCTDGVQNGAETDLNCGGGGSMPCARCAPGQMCALSSDCASGVCLPTGTNLPNRCAAPTCTDGVQNGAETGIDCGGNGDGDGGAPCPPCPDGG